jgi:hypothetical protein
MNWFSTPVQMNELVFNASSNELNRISNPAQMKWTDHQPQFKWTELVRAVPVPRVDMELSHTYRGPLAKFSKKFLSEGVSCCTSSDVVSCADSEYHLGFFPKRLYIRKITNSGSKKLRFWETYIIAPRLCSSSRDGAMVIHSPDMREQLEKVWT